MAGVNYPMVSMSAMNCSLWCAVIKETPSMFYAYLLSQREIRLIVTSCFSWFPLLGRPHFNISFSTLMFDWAGNRSCNYDILVEYKNVCLLQIWGLPELGTLILKGNSAFTIIGPIWIATCTFESLLRQKENPETKWENMITCLFFKFEICLSWVP